MAISSTATRGLKPPDRVGIKSTCGRGGKCGATPKTKDGKVVV